jgi:spore maturation protein CgeB
VYPGRAKLLEKLSEKYKVNVMTSVFGEDMIKTYAQSKIVFNKSCAGEINMRVFETMSSGAMLMTDKLSPETGFDELFQDGKHMVCYRDEKELVNKTGYYLAHDTEREQITMAGYNEVVSKHTYNHRAGQLINTVKKELNL